jgi:Transposase DDE domain
MLDLDTFLTTLYVLVDDLIKTLPEPPAQPGPKPTLSRSEVITLALISQWKQFGREVGFVRYAHTHLKAAFPGLPSRTQLNRAIRAHHDDLVAVGQALVRQLGSAKQAYELLDGMGVAVRNNRRKGRGWLSGIAAIGFSNRLGWYDGFHVLTAVDPRGVLTGYAIAPANAKEQPYTEDFLAARMHATQRLAMVGRKARGVYLADTGFEGRERHQRWARAYDAVVLAPPRNDRRHAWPRAWRRWHARLRQLVEVVHGKWTEQFRLDDERPHTLDGFLARFAALAALHNACICINRALGRPDLAFADLVQW